MCIEIHPPVPVEMFHITVLSLIFLLTARARLQGGPFGSDRFSDISGLVEYARKNAMSMLGDYGTTISTANGTTAVTAMIAGKRYSATFPKDATIYTNTFIKKQKGRFYEVFEITVNGERYTYKTVDGQTTVIDSKGRKIKNGGPFGPFHVTSTREYMSNGVNIAPHEAY